MPGKSHNKRSNPDKSFGAEQMEFKFSDQPESQKKKLLRFTKVKIQGISQEKIQRALQTPGITEYHLLAFKTKGQVEQRVNSVIAEIESIESMLQTQTIHHSEITELRSELSALSREKMVLEKLLK
tara:strand:- start:2719 stop:3096 length:378 start_codon:yes stop_codon:yes gene_type:complete